MIDGVVWKLRDPKVSQALRVNVDAPPMLSGTPAMQRAGRLTRTSMALVAASVVFVVLALVDQVRYVLTSQSVISRGLKRARR